MKNKNLAPLVIFCIIFLAYSLYFVRVINTTDRLEPDSIAKTIQRVIEEGRETPPVVEDAKEVEQPVVDDRFPLTQYVNYRWLNVRENPSLASPVMKKIFEDEAVEVLDYPTTSWAFVKITDGTKGYVARRYLRDEAPIVSAPVVTETQPTPDDVPEPEVVIYDVPVITYHHISDEIDKYAPSLVLPEVNLFAQLDYLVENDFKSYTFHDLQAVIDGNKTLDDKAVILTFNGGYNDAYLAAQHLNGKGMKGVFFIFEKVRINHKCSKSLSQCNLVFVYSRG